MIKAAVYCYNPALVLNPILRIELLTDLSAFKNANDGDIAIACPDNVDATWFYNVVTKSFEQGNGQ